MENLLLDEDSPPVLDLQNILESKVNVATNLEMIGSENNGNGVSKPEPSKKIRSRNGCFNCKKLKIKCNEIKPICEYCQHTGRLCVYPEKKEKAKRKRRSRKTKNSKNTQTQQVIEFDVIEEYTKISSPKNPRGCTSLTTKSNMILNSMTLQLNISPFELRLMKVYLKYGPLFFTFNTDPISFKFWEDEVPKLWCSSDLIKSSIYAISSTLLLTNYKFEEIKDALIEDDVQSLFLPSMNSSMIHNSSKVNLYEISNNYLQKSADLLNIYSNMLSYSYEPQEIVGQIVIAKAILFGTKGCFPSLNKVNSPRNIAKCGVLELAGHLTISFHTLSKNLSLLEGTRFECVTVPNERKIIECDFKFYFIEYLRSYISQMVSSADFLQITFHDLISRMEKGSYRSLIFKYPIPLFRSFIDFANYEDFINGIKTRDHPSMKIMNCFTCLCSLLDFGLFRGYGIWDEFIELYKIHSFELFNGEFEDEFDQNLYDCVISGIKGEIPCNIEILKNIGRPAKDLIEAGTSKIESVL